MSCFPIASDVPDQCNNAATSTATVDSGPTSEGEYPQEFDSDGEYSDGDYDKAYMDRSGQIDTNLRDLRAKLKDQVFHDFKDHVHYVVYLTLAYSIWLCRNKVVFGGSVESKHKLMDTLQYRSFGYITTKLD
ncbi:hypothetical protein Ancab_039563 [Ancistrocladus abbreviatus]